MRTDVKYFLYARRSSDEGSDRQVQSIDDQVKSLTKLANDFGLEIVDVLTESHSAKIPGERKVYKNMLQRIENKDANGILCWQINRLSRNPVDSARVQWLLQQGVIQSIQTIDGERTPNDNAVLFSVEAGVSNQYIIDLSKNIKRGLYSKVEKGWLPCLAPQGYLNEPYERTVVIDTDRFSLVRKMFDMFLSGNYSPVQIVNIANNEWGYRTRKTRRGGDRPLSISEFYRILNSKFYFGVIEYNGNEYIGKHEPMITGDEFWRIQELLGKKGKPRPQTKEHAYTGLMVCQECGSAITAETKTKFVKSENKYKDYTYYRCTKRKSGTKCMQKGCVSVDVLEQQILDEIGKYTILPEFRDWALEVLNESNDHELTERQKIYETQQQSVQKMQRELDNLTKMRYRDLIEDEEFIREKKELTTKINYLRLKIKGTEDRADSWLELTEQTFNFAADAIATFKNGTKQEKRQILNAFFDNPVLNNGKLILSARRWFVVMQEGYKPLVEKYNRLELEKHVSYNNLQLIRERWWRWRESNPRPKCSLMCFYDA